MPSSARSLRGAFRLDGSAPAVGRGTPGTESGGEDLRTPGFVGRREISRSILDRLASGGGAGCILVGEAGSGKTALIHHILRHSGTGTYVVHVRGSEFSGRTPFGALTFLLSELEPDVASHPVLILRGLTQLIRERAQGRAVLLAVDNAEELDEFSAMVLSQMVLNRSAGLLASFRDFSRAPSEFMGLWREGILSRVDLEPLDAAETAELAAAALGGPLSSAAVVSLREYTGGNPQLLALACGDYRESGRLRRSDGIWVLDPRRAAPAGRMAETVLDRISGVTPPQLALIQTLALSGSLPLSVALAGTDAAEVDTLQEQGILAVDRQPVPAVQLVDPVLARVICLTLGTGVRRELLERLTEAAGGTGAAGRSAGLAFDAGPAEPAGVALDPCRLAAWLLDIGEPLAEGIAVEAARAANAAGRYTDAVRFISGLQDYQQVPSAVLELLQARTAQGEFGTAMGVLTRHRGEGVQPSPVEGIRLLLAESELLCMAATGALDTGDVPAGVTPRRHEELMKQAQEQITGLGGAGAPSRSESAALERELILARARCHSVHGRFLENAAFLAPIFGGTAHQDPDFRVQTGSWLCEARGMTDRQSEALELSQEVTALLADGGAGQAARTQAFARLLQVQLAMGSLNTCADMLRDQQKYTGSARFLGLFGELADGLLHAYAGRPEEALRALVPGLAQLRLRGPECLLPLAAAAAAYCHALREDRDQSRSLLQLRAAAHDGGPWLIRRSTRHFAALAETALGSAHTARRFVDLASHDHRRGAYAYELLSLVTAVRLGNRETLDRVLTVAAHQQGPFARMCETYAKGTGSYDAQLLIQAGEMGERSGHVLFAREASERALAVASGAGDRATVRFIHRSRRGTGSAGESGGADATDQYLSALTFRERSIARRAAAGTSNKTIAAELSISVRTVEGHLYQVYSKLHVGSRRELAKVMAEKAGSGK